MFVVFILLYFVNIYVIMCVCIIVIININIIFIFIFIKYYYIINPPRDILGLSRAFWRKKKIIKRLLWSGLGHDKHVRTFRLLCFTSLSLVNCRGVIRCGPTSPIISSRRNSSSRRRRTSGIWFYKTRKKKICTTKIQRKGILYIYGWTNCAYSEQTPLVYLLVSLPALIPRKLNYVTRIYRFKKNQNSKLHGHQIIINNLCY